MKPKEALDFLTDRLLAYGPAKMKLAKPVKRKKTTPKKKPKPTGR